METIKLSSKGQLVIPKSMRDAFDWRRGMEFCVQPVEEGLLLRPMRVFASTRLRDVVGCASYHGARKTVADMQSIGEVRGRSVLSVDPTVLVRLIANDDPKEGRRAAALLDMPKKKQTVAAQAAARGPLPELPVGVIDELVKGPMTPEQVQGLMLALNKAVIERIMGAEMNVHLGYTPGGAKPAEQDNG